MFEPYINFICFIHTACIDLYMQKSQEFLSSAKMHVESFKMNYVYVSESHTFLSGQFYSSGDHLE